MDEMLIHTSGGISGAITDPYSKSAFDFANSMYIEIRKWTTDCQRIAENTNYTLNTIRKIKDYLFYDLHKLENGYKRFDPDFHIAQSWRRLSSRYKNEILPHDLLLLKHELEEIKQQKNNPNLSQSDAHKLASSIYNYQEKADQYLEELKLSKRGYKR